MPRTEDRVSIDREKIMDLIKETIEFRDQAEAVFAAARSLAPAVRRLNEKLDFLNQVGSMMPVVMNTAAEQKNGEAGKRGPGRPKKKPEVPAIPAAK